MAKLTGETVSVHPMWKTIRDGDNFYAESEDREAWLQAWDDLRDEYRLTGKQDDDSGCFVYRRINRTVFVHIESENVWHTRFTMGITPTQAVISMGTDAVRQNYEQYSKATDKRDYISREVDNEFRVLKHQAKNWELVWKNRVTEIGTEKTLTAFGKYLLTVINYYANTSDNAYEGILHRIEKKVG